MEGRTPGTVDTTDAALISARRSPARQIMCWALRLAYPLAILGGLRFGSPRYVALIFLVLLWLQRWCGAGSIARLLRQLTLLDWVIAAALTVWSATAALTDSETALRLYPALVNTGLLIAFAATLIRPPSMIEKFARLREPDLPPAAISHTRRVTWIWCVFFALNSAFSVYTALALPRTTWALYNGGIVYVLIGALIVGEIAWRHWIVKPHASADKR